MLIVVLVIAILASIVIVTYPGIQKRARDAQRETDIAALAVQLETYFNDNGSFPLRANVTATTLRGVDQGAFIPPGYSSPQIIDASTTAALGGRVANSSYGYQTFALDGVTTCTAASGCPKYRLYWVREDSPNDTAALQTKSSL